MIIVAKDKQKDTIRTSKDAHTFRVEAAVAAYAAHLARVRVALATFDADVARAIARAATLLVVMVLVGCGGPAFSTVAPDAEVVTSGDEASALGQGDSEASAADVGAPGDGGQLAEAHLADAAPSDGGDAALVDAPACLTTLSGVGPADFYVSFLLTTTTTSAMALVNQSGACQAACGGRASTEWDVFLAPDGLVQVETDDGVAADRIFVLNGAHVNDGNPHHIIASRVGGQLSVSVDGVSSATVSDSNELTTLPALVVGSDPCAASSGAAGCPAVHPLDGSLTELCLTL
jgi:hypothetical protein